jgi:hypothetical protein
MAAPPERSVSFMLSAIDIHTAPAPATGRRYAGTATPVFARKSGNGGRFALMSRCAS